jgi:hypothetical protein
VSSAFVEADRLGILKKCAALANGNLGQLRKSKVDLRTGLPVGAGTDATRVATYNPYVSLYWLVTGKTVGGFATYDNENRLNRMEALRLWTVGSSWFSTEQGTKGSIVTDQLADLAVLSPDHFGPRGRDQKPRIGAHDCGRQSRICGGRVRGSGAAPSTRAAGLVFRCGLWRISQTGNCAGCGAFACRRASLP